MYIPGHFREDRLEVMYDLIHRNSLATLVTLGPDGLIANHIPMFLDASRGSHGSLRCHVARANEQWIRSDANTFALAIFQGPAAYVTPNWYPTRSETGKVVPTFDFVAVHAYGKFEVHDDVHWLAAHVRELTSQHEAPFAPPWNVGDAPEDFIQAQLKGIVGIEIEIVRLEGKWKVSQNRSVSDRMGVVDGLTGSERQEDRAMAALIPLE